MSKGYTTEIIRRVYDDDNGACIEIRPGTDGFGVEMLAPDDASKDYFGPLRFFIASKEMALRVGQALLDAANEVVE